MFAGGTGIGLLRVGCTLCALAHGALLDKVGRSRSELALELLLPRMRRVQLSLKLVGGCDSFSSCSVGLGGQPLRRTLGLRTGRPLAL